MTNNPPHQTHLQQIWEKLLKSFDQRKVSLWRCAQSPHSGEYVDGYINDNGREYHIQVTYIGTKKEIKKSCAEDERRQEIAFNLVRSGIDYKNRALVEKFVRSRYRITSNMFIEDIISKAHGIHHPYPFEDAGCHTWPRYLSEKQP
jgi:hypothetical protein